MTTSCWMCSRLLALFLVPLCLGCTPGPAAETGLSRDTGGTDELPPEPPEGMQYWLSGSSEDVAASTAGPGLILMGGGPEPDEAFHWWRDRLGGGDVVVVRASGSDGYNDYLYEDIGGVDSVLTMLVDRREHADHAWVRWQVDHAEGVFIAGGDQWDYVASWKGTALNGALDDAPERGATLGGTSAGLAILGDRSYSAEHGTVTSEQALLDPYHERVTFEDDLLHIDRLAAVVTDSHLTERDRLGRLVAFVARTIVDGVSDEALGIGVDEGTALVVEADGLARVVGRGHATLVRADDPPETCAAGEPLSWSSVQLTRLASGQEVQLPGGESSVEATSLFVVEGVLEP